MEKCETCDKGGFGSVLVVCSIKGKRRVFCKDCYVVFKKVRK